MTDKIHPILKRKRRRLLLLLPLFILPLAALAFWLIKRQAAADSDSLGSKLMASFPEINLEGQEGFDKLGFYERAGRDSAGHQDVFSSGEYSGSSGPISQGTQAGTESIYQLSGQERALEQKLSQLEAAISSDNPPESKPEITKPADPGTLQLARLQEQIESASTAAPDAELLQLESMLDKIMAIQNPQQAQHLAPQKATMPARFSAIPAEIAEDQKITAGGVVALRLLGDCEINDVKLKKGLLIYGKSAISNQRLNLKIAHIVLGNTLIPVDLTVFDQRDAMPGINVPDALIRGAIRDGSDQALSGLQLLPFEQNIETQLAGAGIQAAKGLFRKKLRPLKIKLKKGYRLLLRDNQQ